MTEPTTAEQLSQLLERLDRDIQEACDAMQKAATENRRLKQEVEELRFDRLRLVEEIARLKKERQQIGAFGYLAGKVASA